MADQNSVALARGLGTLLEALIDNGAITAEQARGVGRVVVTLAAVTDKGALGQPIHEAINRAETRGATPPPE